MSSARHLIIPFAHAAGLQGDLAPVAGELTVLRKLLARLQADPLHAGEPSDLSPPHERALAQALGLPGADGTVPWAAWDLLQAGRAPGDAAWAWITPCHWHVAQDHILMHPPEGLQLDEVDARALLGAIAPYMREDGIEVEYVAPTRWRARGEVFRGLACASLDRVTGRRVDDWLPRTPAARPLRRLQQEMQMLLYTHPVNEAREAAGLAPVNSFWVSGAGALVQAPGADARFDVQEEDRLRAPALAGTPREWAAAWRAIDAQALPALLHALDAGHRVALTLCGERSARTWVSTPLPVWQRALRLLRPPLVARALEDL